MAVPDRLGARPGGATHAADQANRVHPEGREQIEDLGRVGRGVQSHDASLLPRGEARPGEDVEYVSAGRAQETRPSRLENDPLDNVALPPRSVTSHTTGRVRVGPAFIAGARRPPVIAPSAARPPCANVGWDASAAHVVSCDR